MRDCHLCKELLHRASDATTQHLAAIGRLQIATIRQDRTAAGILEQQVTEARTVRTQAMAEYQAHEQSHRLEAAAD